MKVLFLDVDGVLNKNNTPPSWYDEKRQYLKGLDPVLVQRYLRWRAEHTTFETILSSSWREDMHAKALLKANGVYWTGNTPWTGQSLPRGWEISQWLAMNPRVTKVAILDDFPGTHLYPVARYLVQTSDNVGLQDKHLRKVNELLDL